MLRAAAIEALADRARAQAITLRYASITSHAGVEQTRLGAEAAETLCALADEVSALWSALEPFGHWTLRDHKAAEGWSYGIMPTTDDFKRAYSIVAPLADGMVDALNRAEGA